MATVSLVGTDAQLPKTIIIGVQKGADGPVLAPGANVVTAVLGRKLLAGLKALGATGRAEEVTKVATLGLAPFDLVVAVGLGASGGALEAETVRRAVGAAVRSLSATGAVHVAIGTGADVTIAAAAAEGALLGSYSYTEFKSAPKRSAPTRIAIATADPKGRPAVASLRRAKALSDAVALTRDLVNAPPNEIYPATLAKRFDDAATAAGLEVEILDERALKRGRYGGILGVGSGSVRPPRLVRVSYSGARARTRVALIGKGITYDSGGLNLKPGSGMATMKSDMGGAAAVVATVVAAARLRLPIDVTATVSLAENMVSGSSYRPSDVLTLRSGKTLEIANTDAEGRIVLADAISRACEDNPDYLIEASTLTGAQVVALGNRVIAAMGEPAFRDRVAAAGNSVGEAVWSMPLPDDLRPGLESQVADLSNLPAQGWGGMLAAGLFLGEFVTDGLPWVHLDIAGPSYNSSAPHGYTPKGGTGAAVRTLLASLELLASEG
ncbi:leucyl aminopeptidase [Frankineae bacterium MT45]|nr:leucyl aminopeptidase [Frankineae bacterium MT45]